MEISNELIYEGRLECATDEVAMATLVIPQWDVAAVEVETKWLKDSLDPAHPVRFLDTDSVRLICHFHQYLLIIVDNLTLLGRRLS